jgi:acyl-CoA thioester hydrolase
MIETYRGKVYPNQLDHMGHMNVQWYTAKFDEATWHLLSHIGINNRYIRENERGMAALEQKISYKAEVMSGDLLVVKSEVLEVSDKTVRFKHHMFNVETGTLSATSELLGVHLDKKIRKSTPLPAFAKTNCEKLIG